MIIGFRKIPCKNNLKFKTMLFLRCDDCKKEYFAMRTLFLLRQNHFCSRVCLNQSQRTGVIKQKKENYFLEKFGVKNPFQSEKIKFQIEETNLKRFGTRSHNSSQIVKNSKIKTCLERYGVENPFQINEIKQQIKLTNLKRYGFENPLQNSRILSKNQRSRRLSSIQIHWKTNEELNCIASYEVAFVNWCKINCIDFDWQISHKMSDNRVYIIDAFIKSGEFANTWIESKGYMAPKSKEKWEWFHSNHPNDSQLWTKDVLEKLKVIS